MLFSLGLLSMFPSSLTTGTFDFISFTVLLFKKWSKPRSMDSPQESVTNLGPHPDLLNQHLHFNRIPRWPMYTVESGSASRQPISQSFLFPFSIVLSCTRLRSLTLKQKKINLTTNRTPVEFPSAVHCFGLCLTEVALRKMVCFQTPNFLKKSLPIPSTLFAYILRGL